MLLATKSKRVLLSYTYQWKECGISKLCKSSCGKCWKSYFLLPAEQMKGKRMFQTHTRKKFFSFLKDPSFASSYFWQNFHKAKLIHLCKKCNFNTRAVCCSGIFKISFGIKVRTAKWLCSLYLAENLCGMWVGILLIASRKHSLF